MSRWALSRRCARSDSLIGAGASDEVDGGPTLARLPACASPGLSRKTFNRTAAAPTASAAPRLANSLRLMITPSQRVGKECIASLLEERAVRTVLARRRFGAAFNTQADSCER